MQTPLRVLVLEDQPADAELMLHELRRAGFDPDWRRVETEADYLAHLDPALDLILADYNLPQFDGLRALHLLHERGLDIPFIIVSGKIGEDVAVECMKKGASDYLLKDRLARLGPAVTHALEQKGLRDERKRAEEIRRGLYRACLEVQEPVTLQERVDRLLQMASDVLHLDRVNILLADVERRWLEAVACLGTDEPLDEILVPIGPEGGAIAQAYVTKRAVFWDGQASVPEELRLKPPYDQIEAFRSRVFANIPLIVQGRTIGVLGADRKHSRRPFEPDMRELLQLFASQAAIAIEHARLYEETQQYAATLESQVAKRTQQLHAANLRLEQASRFKSEFLANMSHELRTPLNSILGFSELLEDQQFGSLNEKQQRYLHNVWTSGRHLLDLINDILDLSKVEAGKLEIEPEPFGACELLETILAIVRPQAAKKQVSLNIEIDPAVGKIMADPLRFKQVVFNLLSNAVKFTPPGGSVTVSASLTPSATEIRVTDTGVGIGPEDQLKLFQEFSQVGGEYARQQHGAGLGLALSKKIVELHGGRIWVESAGEGKGSTFAFRLPLSGAPPSSSD